MGALLAFAVAFGAAGVVVDAAPAGAATTNPCKVLKQSEIQKAFGGTVGSGKKGLSTPVSTQCEFPVGAAGDRPDGTVIVHVMTTGAKAAYTGLLKLFLDRFPTDGLCGVAVPLMLGAGPGHALAPELTLRPVLTEIGGVVPAKGLYVVDAAYDDPAAYAHWLDLARPVITAILDSKAGVTS